MELIFVIVIAAISHIDAQLWMPFSHLGPVLQAAMKQSEAAAQMNAMSTPALDFMSFATRPWIKNLTQTWVRTTGDYRRAPPSMIIHFNNRPIVEQSSSSAAVRWAQKSRPTTILPSTTTLSTTTKTTTTLAPSTTTPLHVRFASTTTHAPPTSSLRPSKIIEIINNKYLPTKSIKNTSCEVCKPGRPCELKLRSFETSDQIFQYAYSHSTAIDESINAIMRETQGSTLPPPLGWKSTCSPEVVQLATNLMRLYKPNRSLVVGVFTGVALLGIASMTDMRGIVVAMEYPEFAQYWDEFGLRYAIKQNLMNRIQLRTNEDIDKTLMRLATNEPNAFDFVFLDDHRQVNYLDDYEHCIRLLRSGGLMIITDAFNGGSVLSGPEYITQEAKAVQNMNIRIKNDSRVTATFLPFSGGVWMITKK